MGLTEGSSTRKVWIKEMKANEAHKILGMRVAPDGNQKEQVSRMVEQVKK